MEGQRQNDGWRLMPYRACAIALLMNIPGCAVHIQPTNDPIAISEPEAEIAPRHHRFLPPMPLPYYGEMGPPEIELQEDAKLSEIQARLRALNERLAIWQRMLENRFRND
jgi:hypothetical protein